jgi:hypothetical protein
VVVEARLKGISNQRPTDGIPSLEETPLARRPSPLDNLRQGTYAKLSRSPPGAQRLSTAEQGVYAPVEADRVSRSEEIGRDLLAA